MNLQNATGMFVVGANEKADRTAGDVPPNRFSLHYQTGICRLGLHAGRCGCRVLKRFVSTHRTPTRASPAAGFSPHPDLSLFVGNLPAYDFSTATRSEQAPSCQQDRPNS